MKVLIVDDEPLAQARVARLLGTYGHIHIAGYASNGAEALELAAKTQPDVVFIDVEMPQMNGLEAAQQLSEQSLPPAIVFITAHPNHALDAFKVMPTAYLLKPLEAAELDKVINKLGQQNRAQVNHKQRQQLSYKLGNQLKTLSLDEVLYVARDGKYTQAVCESAQVLLDTSLKELEQQFPTTLLRVHRNTLVNRNKVTSLTQSQRQYQIFLQGCEQPLPVSRREVSKVKDLLYGDSSQ